MKLATFVSLGRSQSGTFIIQLYLEIVQLKQVLRAFRVLEIEALLYPDNIIE